MTQYKKYLEDNYTKGTIEACFKEITIFNNFSNQICVICDKDRRF